MKELLKSVFPNYTDAMYEGNEPCGKGHEHVNGGYCDRWSCKYGCGSKSIHNSVHLLELEKIEEILNKNFDCEFWKMVQNRAKSIYKRM